MVVVSPTAEEDIETAFLRGLRNHGLEAAERYVQDLRDALARLAAFPDRGQSLAFVRPGLRRLVYRSHIAYYEVRPEEVRVLRIEHARQNRPIEP